MTPTARPLLLPIAISRNVRMQLAMCGLVAVAMAAVVPWWLIAAWFVAMITCVWLEEHFTKTSREAGRAGGTARLRASALAVAWACGYALAARSVMGTGWGNGFALSLMAVTMVAILLRSYRSPVVFLLSIAPHLAVLGSVEWKLTELTVGGTGF